MQLPQTTPHMPNCSALYRFGYNNSLQLNEQLLSRVSFDHAPDQVQLACISALMGSLQHGLHSASAARLRGTAECCLSGRAGPLPKLPNLRTAAKASP